MCVVSMIVDHKRDEWRDRYWPRPGGTMPPLPQIEPPSKEEIEEFRRLLDRARQYDIENNEPDCELDSKRQALKRMAEELGVEIEFV